MLGGRDSVKPFDTPIQGSGVGFGLLTLVALGGGHLGIFGETFDASASRRGCCLDEIGSTADKVVMGEGLWLKGSCRGTDGEALGTFVAGYCFVGKMRSGTKLCCNEYIEFGIW